MTAIVWDAAGERQFETGVDRGVLYSPDNTGAYTTGVAWNGLTAVTESPSGAESNKQYADNLVYVNLISAEEFGGTIEAFMAPTAFAQHDGTAVPKVGVYLGQQTRKPFGLSFRTKIGNDLDPEAGYKLHLIWGAQASPSEKAYNTINDSPEAIGLSWEFTTTPVPVAGYKPTSLITINSLEVDPDDLAALELILYGTTGVDPELPDPADVIALFSDPAEWAATTAYVVGDNVRLTGGARLTALVAGTSAATEPLPPALSGTVTDGTVLWHRLS